MYVKNDITQGVKIVKNHFDTILWLKLDKAYFDIDDDILLAGVYMWVENSPAYNVVTTDLFQLLQNDIHTYSTLGKVMLVGDWNARVGNGDRRDYIVCDQVVDGIDDDTYYPDTPLYRKSMDTTCNNHGLKLLDLCKANSLRIANGRLGKDYNIGSYTFASAIGASVIDYLILGESSFNSIRNFTVCNFCEWSDHAPISLNIVTGKPGDKRNDSFFTTRVKWDESLRDRFRSGMIAQLPLLNSITQDNDFASRDDVNTCIEQFTSVLNEVAKPLFCKTVINNNKIKALTPICKKAIWFDAECVQAKQVYQTAVKLYNGGKTDINRISMYNAKRAYKSLVKGKRNRARLSRMREIERLRHSKPKDFWKHFSKNKKLQNSNISTQEFFNFFSTLDNNLPNPVQDEADQFNASHDFSCNECSFQELDMPITVSEITKTIRALNKNKAFSGDQLINEYFIESCDIIASHLSDVFNGILNSGFFPDSWMEGEIVPLFKKNDPNDVNNYRGIALVSCFSKIFTGVLNRRISDWVDINNVVSDAQFGFRKGRSTVDAIFVLNAIIQHVLSQNGRLACAFIDFKKAFDSIYRNGLWFKLHKNGVDGKMLRVIRDLYSKVKLRIKGCKSFSDYFECSIGLKQGEVLSPVLFSMFLEDLELFMLDDINRGLSLDELSLILMLFADDMVIFGKNIEDLQHSLDLLKQYCDKWGLEVNTTKSKIVVFRKRGGLKAHEVWLYNGTPLEVVNDFNYLGTVLNYTGNFNLNQETLSGKGLKALNALLANTRDFVLKPKVVCQLFDAFVGSTLNYASEIWGFSKSKEIERIHLKMCKSLLSVKTSTCNMAVYGELGRYPLYINRHYRIIKYWSRVVNSNNIIVQHLYNSLKQDCNIGTTNWASKVKELLERYGFGYIWNDTENVEWKPFCMQFKQRLIDEFAQSWTESIGNSGTLCTYSLFKCSFGYETYLDKLSRTYRHALTRLRLSSHQLRIEAGRYGVNRTERNQRYCTFCDRLDLEDEYHFIIICPTYNDLRHIFLKRFYYVRPSMFKFIELMNCQQYRVMLNLGKFIYQALQVRQSRIVATVGQ